MIIDCTIGFNELDLFCIRYHELKDIVDKFVVVEATHTHRGTPKQTYFKDWASGVITHNGFAFEHVFDVDKVEIITWDNGADFAPTVPEYAWMRENIQREIVGMWAVKHLAPTDLVILSDMDEIPSAESLRMWTHEKTPHTGVYRFKQTLSYLYMNTTAGDWCGSKIFPVSVINALTDVETLAHTDRPMTDLVRYRPEHMIAGTIENGGWHFSSIGGLEAVRVKFDSYAHTEMSEKSNADIADSLTRVVDPFHKNPLTVVDCNRLPQYVLDNLEYFTAKGYIYAH